MEEVRRKGKKNEGRRKKEEVYQGVFLLPSPF